MALTLTAAMTACGAAERTSGANDTAGKITVDADAVLRAAYEGVVSKPPADGPPAATGKTIWFSNCLGFEGCARFGDGFKEAAASLGWTVKEVDNKNTPGKSIDVIRQAIAAHADAVVDTLSDCPNIRAGLEAAKKADLPVITYAGLDCDHPSFGRGGEPLYAAPLKLGQYADTLDYYRGQGAADAEYILALAVERKLEAPSILQTRNANQLFQKARAEGFAKKVKELCPKCTLEPLDFTTEQLVAGKGQQVYKSGMLRHPDSNILYYANDAFLAPGLQAALESNKGKFDIVCCGDGGKQGIANVRRSGELAGVYTVNSAPLEMWGWDAVDVLNRVFAGESRKDIPGEANVSFYVDPDHNLPAKGKPVKVPFDYKSAYTGLWKGAGR
ncbi:sugar ABC transporter substrate-binding protein [Streptomyces chartreusis]|uniref:sugar ABC transporter substrate-binding protein n=1 Tax=Streptomyces chartreusis TaxID=1969 RepID=UPI003678D466